MPTKPPTTTLNSADKAVPHLHSDSTDLSGRHADAHAGLHADDEKDPPASGIVDEIEPAVDPDPAMQHARRPAQQRNRLGST